MNHYTANPNAMVEKLEKIIGVKQTRLESIKRLQGGGRNGTLTLTNKERIKLARSKREVMKQIADLEAQRAEWAEKVGA